MANWKQLLKNRNVRWAGIIAISLIATGALTYLLLHVVLLLSGEESLNSVSDLGFGDFSNVLDHQNASNNHGWSQDPFLSDNSTQVWANSGNGLSLVILDALEDRWTSIFETAVSDWQKSDALTLYPKRVDVDYGCSRVQGKMKVCSGNYGNTGCKWKGKSGTLLLSLYGVWFLKWNTDCIRVL